MLRPKTLGVEGKNIRDTKPEEVEK